MAMTFDEDFLTPPAPDPGDGGEYTGQNAGQEFTPRDSSAPDTAGLPAFADAGGTGPSTDLQSDYSDPNRKKNAADAAVPPVDDGSDQSNLTQAAAPIQTTAAPVSGDDPSVGSWGVGLPGSTPPAADWSGPAGTMSSAPSGGGIFGRVKDFAGGVQDFVGDVAKTAVLPERAVYDSFQSGNTPWDDPGAFVKDVYSSAAGQAKTDLGYLDAGYRAANNMGGRIQGSAAIAANDLVQGNWGQIVPDLNPASNAYYGVTGERPPWMPDVQYAARQVVAQNPFGAVVPGTAGNGEGPQVIPDTVPIVGGRDVYNLPGDAGLARGVAAVGGGFTGDAWGQGPSIDVNALRRDLANGMSVEEARQKYGGSAGTRTVSELLNPGNNIGLPGVPKAVGEAAVARSMWEQLHHPEVASSPATAEQRYAQTGRVAAEEYARAAAYLDGTAQRYRAAAY